MGRAWALARESMGARWGACKKAMGRESMGAG